MKIPAVEVLIGGIAALAGYLITGEALGASAALVLVVGLKLLATGDGLVVLCLAFGFQWVQVSLGVFYTALTGRSLVTSMDSDYRPMVWLGLGCILAIAVGVRAGTYLVRRLPDRRPERPDVVVSWPALILLYAIAVAADPFVNSIAQVYGTWRQVLITLTVVRLGLLFIIARRLTIPTLRWRPLLLLVGVEVARGFTGYFAGFREPLVIGAIVLLEVFDRRRTAHWFALTVLLVTMGFTSVMWMGVRSTYRAEVMEVESLASSQTARLNRITDLGSVFFRGETSDILTAADNLVDRVWAVYYPALALVRVPTTLPHTHGTLLWGAIQHVLTPRVFFPDKPDLVSDSEMVRKYSGLWVAGPEQNTSIAFGYAGESYIDFGVPLMFLPPLGYGVLMGMAYAWLVRHIRNVELMIATVNVIFWLALYLFERSWANTLGNAMSLLVYLAIPIALIDNFLLVKFIRQRQDAGSYTTAAT